MRLRQTDELGEIPQADPAGSMFGDVVGRHLE